MIIWGNCYRIYIEFLIIPFYYTVETNYLGINVMSVYLFIYLEREKERKNSK